MKLDKATSDKMRALDESKGTEWNSILKDMGEDPKTFFQHSNWADTDFSMSDMSGASFKGAIIDGCKFRKGDLTSEMIAEARSARSIIEVEPPQTQH